MEPIYTAEEVADLLKVRLSFVRTEIANGSMPHLRLGRRKTIRIREAHLRKYLDAKEEHSNGAHPDDVGEDDG